ncbi:MAG: sensor histidine kinase [Solirubrobacteraceae bacterium]
MAASLVLPVLLRGAVADAPALRAATETMMSFFALAAAWLFRAEFVAARRLRDLLLVASTSVLASMTFFAAALPAALNLHAGHYFVGARLWGALLAGAMFATAALTPSTRLVPRRGHPLAIMALSNTVALLIAGVGGLLLRPHDVARTALGYPITAIAVIAATGLLTYAAAGFARRQRLESDLVAGLLAGGLILVAGASFSYLLRGSLVPGRMDAGVGLRAIGFALILVAAVIRDRQVHARNARASALAERRRVARDLHDGIAQDLAFIAAHGPSFAEELGEDHPMVVAARRALAMSRSTISDLSDPQGATVHESLEAVAQELRARFSIAIAVDAQPGHDLDSGAREHVTRIAREAIANAARHGQAQNVIVSLRSTDGGFALRVRDDGCGLERGGRGPAPEGFGLNSMRERAAAIGGELIVRQPRAGGTELEVVLP